MAQINSVAMSYNDASGKMSYANPDAISVGGNIVPQTKTLTFSISASSATNAVFIADEKYQVTAVAEVHATASSSGTLQVEKLTGTTAPGSGTNMLTGTVSLSGTANTVASGSLSATASNLQLAVGDRLGLVFGGTMTSLAGGVVTITLKRI